MDVTKFKPGRRLDAMVAMCLGWKWWTYPDSVGRFLIEPDRRTDCGHASGTTDRLCDDPPWCMFVPNYSTSPGIAFEAALEAGVWRYCVEARFDDVENEYQFWFATQADEFKAWNLRGESPAHAMCLGILAIQPEDKLAEFESWLPEEVE